MIRSPEQDLGGETERESSKEGQSSMDSRVQLRRNDSSLDEATWSPSTEPTGSFSLAAVRSLREGSATQARKGNDASHHIKRVLSSRDWNTAFLISIVLAVSVDPLFFYIPSISDPKQCIFFDSKLAVTASVLRSAFDCFHLIYIGFRLHIDFFTPFLHHKRGHSVTSNPWKIARRYLCSFFSLVDIMSVLPFPQVLILIIMLDTKGSRLLDAMTFLKLAVVLQFLPRVIRIYQVFNRDRESFIAMAHAPWPKAAYNLLLYMLASHVVGALWYFYAIERVADCWQATSRSPNGSKESFVCNDSITDRRVLDMSCSAKSPKMRFQYGMFLDAVESRIITQATFLRKFFHCFRWGIQNLSCFGQNIKPSIYIWENCFAVSISIAGVLLFVFLIGNMQTYLHTKTVRSEERRLKTQEIEQWKPFSKLPDDIQRQVKRYQRYKWQETRGVDVEQLLQNLPLDLRRQIKCKLGLQLLKNVPNFDLMGDRVVESLCCRLKPVLFVERNYIFREGDPVDEMLFIVQGRLCIYPAGRTSSRHEASNHGRHDRLESGDFCGEELLEWIQDPADYPRLPISRKTVQAQTKVEAFALLADDLRLVYIQNQWRLHKELRDRDQSYGFSDYRADYWFAWAARIVQSAWRRRQMSRGTLPAAGDNGGGKWAIKAQDCFCFRSNKGVPVPNIFRVFR